MVCQTQRRPRVFSRFLADEAGVATIDWVLMCIGATGAGMIALQMSEDGLGQYSSGVRDEVQSPHFNTSWTDTLPIPPEEVWGEQDPITPTSGGSTSGGNGNGNGNGNPNGNNGHGNDADGCDSSNPSGNCNDGTDDDGTTPGSAGGNGGGDNSGGNGSSGGNGNGNGNGSSGGNGNGNGNGSSGGNGNGNGNPNGNNGHGNDADGCDSSNPSGNCNDGTDDDGTTPGSNGGNGNGAGGGDSGGQADGGSDGGEPAPETVETVLAVSNPGFESGDNDDGDWSSGVPGWSVQTSGNADAGDFNPSQWSLDPAYVTGSNVAYLYNHNGGSSASISQTFAETYSADATYEISLDIGDGSYSFSGDQSYEVTLYAGSTAIGSVSGTTGNINALQTVTLTSEMSNPALNGQPVRLEITHPDGSPGDLLVDNVRGTVTAPDASPGISPVPVAQLQPIPPDATVIDLGTRQITPGYGDHVFSDWIGPNQIGIPMPADFVMYGTGNPTGLTNDGSREASGQIEWGAQIRVDVPPCGGSREVQMFVNDGEAVLTFAVERPEWPSNWGQPPANCG